MALDTSPANMLQEIRASEDVRNFHVEVTRGLVEDYTGAHYRKDREPEEPVPENHGFQWLASLTSQVVYDNPQVQVSSRRSGADRRLLKAFEHGLNRWSKDVNLWHELMRVWYDTAFGFGVMRTLLQTVPHRKGWMGIRPMQPSTQRIPPNRFLIDHRCEDPSEARFMGHLYKRDKRDLLEDKRYNRELIEKIAADADLDKAEGYDKDKNEGPPRNEIVLYELWVPEMESADPDEGFHGTLLTLATAYNYERDAHAEPRWVRAPRPFFGPRWGPYKMFGIYLVPGQIYPLSPLAATEQQAREVNAHATALSRAMARRKSFIGYDPNNPQAGHAVKNVRDGEVVAIPGLQTGSVEQIELGAATDRQIESLQLLRERLDRNSGLSDAYKGEVAEDATATAVNEASAGRNARMELVARMFRSCTQTVLESGAWYLWHSEFVAQSITQEAVEDVLPRPSDLPEESEAPRIAQELDWDEDVVRSALRWEPDLIWLGDTGVGVIDPKTMEVHVVAGIADHTFDDLELQIEPYSMTRVSEAVLQKRYQDITSLVFQAVPIMPNTPWFNWQDWLEQLGEVMNQKGLGDMVNMDILRQMWAMQGLMGPAQPGAQSQGAPMGASPRPGGFPQGGPMGSVQQGAPQQGAAMNVG